MNRLMFSCALCVVLCPLLAAQQQSQRASTPDAAQSAQAAQSVSDLLEPTASAERAMAIKKARTICINSETVFISPSTMDRALMKQKDWDKLGLNIINNPAGADLQIQVNRVVFTHIHTYIVTERATGMVLVSGRVRALDGVIASGPMAEQIVKALSGARIPGQPASGD